MKKVAVIGFGYVGKAMVRFLKDHYEVKVYDPYISDNDSELLQKNVERVISFDDVNACELGIICVPTPQSDTGSVDIEIVTNTVKQLNTPLILIKSTVPPKTTKKLVAETGKHIAFSPEYIGEGKYVVQWWKDKGYPHPTDMKYHDFQIVGGERNTRVAIIQFLKLVLGPEVRYIQTDSTTAEVTKYMENAWGATKVTFCNEFANMAEAMGVDYDELRELWLLDGRVERMHTAVFKDNRGFGGKCYPKDVAGIVQSSIESGYEPKLLKTVLEVNKEIRKEI